MIKFLKNGVVVLGITDVNIARIKKDQPIRFNLKELGLEDRLVYIIHGIDEQAIYEQLKQFIDPLNTVMKNSRAKEN